MFGFFNTQSKVRAGAQIYNAAAFSLATYALMTDPTKYGVLGFDMLVHAASYVCLQNDSGSVQDFSSYTLNMIRVGAVFAGLGSGTSNVQFGLALADAAGHTVNALASLFLGSKDESESSTQLKAD